MVETEGSLTGQLIAAQSELAGLQQIYSDNNVRVKSLKAQIDGLSAQIAQFGGTPGSSSERISGIMAPTLRALPLVGTTYTDYFRKAKIQETIFEVLTQEYELAKVEEAKEIPPVKVLDPADFPEMKASPPRGRILVIAAVLGMCFAVGWVWAEYRWERMDDDNSRKVTLLELKSLAIAIARWMVAQAHRGMRRLRKTSSPDMAQE
jgi:capsule polysaccharide export protein KpsE/RkpR